MAGPKTDASGRIVKATDNGQQQNGQAPVPNLFGMLMKDSMRKEIERALPKHVTPDRMVRILMTALRTTPNLAMCTPDSFLGCVLQASQLGLEVNTPLGHAYLIPRNNRKRGILECTLLTGYQGMIELSLRSGRVNGINAHSVRDGDFFEYEFGLHPKLVHRPSGAPDREKREITYVYAVGRIKDAEPVFEVLSRAQVEARRERNVETSISPWKTDYEAMARKTAVRALWKWIPKSSEMALAEQLETTLELGRTQGASFDGEVQEAIQRQGMKPIIDDDDLPVPAFDAETGEVLSEQPQQAHQPEGVPA